MGFTVGLAFGQRKRSGRASGPCNDRGATGCVRRAFLYVHVPRRLPAVSPAAPHHPPASFGACAQLFAAEDQRQRLLHQSDAATAGCRRNRQQAELHLRQAETGFLIQRADARIAGQRQLSRRQDRLHEWRRPPGTAARRSPPSLPVPAAPAPACCAVSQLAIMLMSAPATKLSRLPDISTMPASCASLRASASTVRICGTNSAFRVFIFSPGTSMVITASDPDASVNGMQIHSLFGLQNHRAA